MASPLQSLNPLPRMRALLNRPKPEQVVYFTRGPELLGPDEYRSNFDFQLAKAVMRYRQVSDESLAKALPVSAAAYACTEYRAKTTANIALQTLLEDRPPAFSPLGHFIRTAPQILDDITRSLMIFGRSYLVKRRNKKGWPTGLQWVSPLNVLEITAEYGQVVAYDIREQAFSPYTRYPAAEVVYMQLFDPEPFGQGLSKFEAAWRSISIDMGISTFAAAFFINHARPDGMLILDRDVPMEDSDYQRFKSHWREQFKGATQAHKTGFLDHKATWVPMTSDPKDLAMVELKQTDREDICAIFDTDPILVGMKDAGDPLSANSTLSTAEVNHIRNVTIPFMRSVILDPLNRQWASRDFDKPYLLAVDEAAVPALAEAALLRSETSINLTGHYMLDYPEGRALMGYEPREDYIKRNPEQASQLWQDGIITRGQYAQLVGVPGTVENDPNGNVVLIGGQLYPADQLAAIAQANLAQLTSPPAPAASPFGSLAINNTLPPINVSTPEPKALPAGDETEPGARGSSTGPPEAYAVLSLANDPQLVAYQAKLRDTVFADLDAIRWTEPEQFHITLWYAKLISQEQLDAVATATTDTGLANETLSAGPLTAFDGDGETKPLILPVELTEPLRQLQAGQYSRLEALGVPLSEYSQPDAYQPHITVGYITSDIDVPEVTDVLSVAPQALHYSRGEYYTMHSVAIPHSRPARSALAVEVALNFANNQFVRYAQRALSAALAEQDIAADWEDAGRWRIPLARSVEWTPAALSALLRAAAWDDSRKIDLPTGGFVQRGAELYLSVNPVQLDSLLKAVRVDLEGAGLASDVATGDGILLARVRGDSAIQLPDTPAYPLVGNNLTLYLGAEEYHRWALRGVSQAQVNEIRAWRRAAKHRGRHYDFSPDIMVDHPVTHFIRWALAQAEVELGAVFDTAERMLRGELPTLEFMEAGADA